LQIFLTSWRSAITNLKIYFAEHGVGFHPVASGSFLKCVLVTNV
jgi:hypothetical protein